MSVKKIILRRVGISLIIGFLIGFAISEISFIFLKESVRPPDMIELVIPAGTDERVRQGEAPPTIPEELAFVVGDTLIVYNNDSTDHQLGPLWIPAGSSASLELDQVDNYIFACTFQPSKYLGLDVREALTIWTRLGGIIYAGLPLGAMLALYSIIVRPIKPQEKNSE
jgi:hypothetical protein